MPVGAFPCLEMAASEPTACILVVDGDPDVAAGLTRELEHRYGRDYHLLRTQSARSGLGILDRLAGEGRPVALVIAGLGLPDIPGPEFLSRVGGLHPQAKRAVLVHILEVLRSEALHRAITLGQADGLLTRPWALHDQSLYAQVGDLLHEWREDSERQQFVTVHVVGEWGAPRSQKVRDLLDRHAISYRFAAVDSAEGRELLRQVGCRADWLPVLILFDGRVLVQPTNTELAMALGVRTRPEVGLYDLAVVGAGPAGLSAAVSAASEGLRTVVIEREAFGGQAGTSSRIRNYLGFPSGISGRRLARSARWQAVLFGAELLYGEATGLQPNGGERVVLIRDGRPAVASAVLIATGISYRRLRCRRWRRWWAPESSMAPRWPRRRPSAERRW